MNFVPTPSSRVYRMKVFTVRVILFKIQITEPSGRFTFLFLLKLNTRFNTNQGWDKVPTDGGLVVKSPWVLGRGYQVNLWPLEEQQVLSAGVVNFWLSMEAPVSQMLSMWTLIFLLTMDPSMWAVNFWLSTVTPASKLLSTLAVIFLSSMEVSISQVPELLYVLPYSSS